MNETKEPIKIVKVQFVDDAGNEAGELYRINPTIGISKLNKFVNQHVKRETEPDCAYSYFITNGIDGHETQNYTNGVCIVSTIMDAIEKSDVLAEFINDQGNVIEKPIRIVFHPKSVFNVRPVSRCTADLPGHKQAVLVLAFSPDGRHLVSGGADKFVKFWNLERQLPHQNDEFPVHQTDVVFLNWSPNGRVLASGDRNGIVYLWTMNEKKIWKQTGKLAKIVVNSKKTMHGIVWKPLHLDGNCRYLAVAYHDTTVHIYDVKTRLTERVISGHESYVRYLAWSGDNYLICGLLGGTVVTWNPDTGEQLLQVACHSKTGFINSIFFNTSFVMRCGYYSPQERESAKKYDDVSAEQLEQRASQLYKAARKGKPERMVVTSDDGTLSLWYPNNATAICKRMTGHQNVVIGAQFSPDGLLIASASFDKSIRLWDGITGSWIATLEGHMADVYKLAWSFDSRFLVSGGVDSSLKLWTMKDVRGLATPISELKEDHKIKMRNTAKNCKRVRKSHMLHALPGHAATIWSLDWSPDGSTVASGSKDTRVRLWRC